MKMAKPSERDIDAAGDMISLLNEIDRGYYPIAGEDRPTFFDEDDPEHLRAFYDAVKATLDKGPGWPGRVIGGMCYVIMYDKNEIIDPDSDVIDLHPKLAAALELAKSDRAPSIDSAGEAKDAARWKFLRQRFDDCAAQLLFSPRDTDEAENWVQVHQNLMQGAALDEAIDAAMQPQGAGGGDV